MSNSYLCLLSICIQILQLSLQKNIYTTKFLFKKKKKKTTTSHKKYSFLSQNFYGSLFLNSLKHSKIFVIQILYSYHKSSSFHTNIYYLSFIQISIFFTYYNSYPNQEIQMSNWVLISYHSLSNYF